MTPLGLRRAREAAAQDIRDPVLGVLTTLVALGLAVDHARAQTRAVLADEHGLTVVVGENGILQMAWGRDEWRFVDVDPVVVRVTGLAIALTNPAFEPQSVGFTIVRDRYGIRLVGNDRVTFQRLQNSAPRLVLEAATGDLAFSVTLQPREFAIIGIGPA